jgi:hypothetical protein
MILRLLCIWLVFYSLLSLLMHGTMNLKCFGKSAFRMCQYFNLVINRWWSSLTSNTFYSSLYIKENKELIYGSTSITRLQE